MRASMVGLVSALMVLTAAVGVATAARLNVG
jgi:hypothetical protein